MSLSIAGAIKALIIEDSIPIGEVYRWYAPDAAIAPYCIIFPDSADTPVLKGDEKVIARKRLLQVSLWQTYGDQNDDLVKELRNLLDGQKLVCGDQVLRTRVLDAPTIGDDEHMYLHTPISVLVAYVEP